MTTEGRAQQIPTDVRRRLVMGLGANAYGQIGTVIIQLVGVPILLHAWGTQLYGEWLLLFAMPAYLSIADLGFSQSAANDMTGKVARDDRDGALAVFQTLAVLVYGIAVVGLVLTAVLVPALPLDAWLHLEEMGDGEAQWVLWLLSAQVFAGLPDGVSHAGFRANGDYALHMAIYNTARLAQFGGIWIVALLGAGPEAAAAVFLGVRVIAVSAAVMLLVGRHGWLKFDPRQARGAELRRLLPPATANAVVPLAQALNVQGMVIVVGATLGPIAVVTFATLRTLTRLALQLVLTVAHAAEPELAMAYGRGDRRLMRDVFVQALRGGLWLAVIAATVLALSGKVILDIWTSGDVAMHPVLFAFLLVSSVATVLWYGAFIVLKAANHHLRAATVFVLSSAAAVGLGALLLEWTGEIAYAGLALLVTDMAMAVYGVGASSALLRTGVLSNIRFALNPVPLFGLIRRKTFAV